MELSGSIPKFRECSGDRKYRDLRQADLQTDDSAKLFRHLENLAQRSGREITSMRVLDFGCGRGEFVGYLRSKGIHAYGVEIDEKFLAAGAVLDSLYRDERPLLALVGVEGKVGFPDGYFDLIIANQVFEHVAQLDLVAAELYRLLDSRGYLLTLFPARFKVIEPHYHLTMVHWLPKGPLQQGLIRLLVSLGFGVAPPEGMSRQMMGKVIAEYAQSETFYRSNKLIAEVCNAKGIALDFRLVPEHMLKMKLARSSGLQHLVYVFVARLLPLVALRNSFKTCAAVGRKHRLEYESGA
ncbi:class I SAM-dependent methyltransferase [Duganella qianjiadongensis]|uniref:Methyltransferase domain-containing protein n=1 Tax=Duganella qianjiadongensis TaxID=2692176 RepID=A0ABW9VM26_9BURK|nr:class I SAM-dependent methyltransferase [Duganella qianjiadongensis]MYM40141.1 methyltransferase domain-containing protein [Duganella qianjiadongensis]